MLVVSRPVLRTNDNGPPNGWIIFGRFFNDALVRSLGEQTQVGFRVLPVPQGAAPAEVQGLLDRLGGRPSPVIEEESPERLRCLSLLQGIDGRPALVLVASVSRRIFAEGSVTMRTAAQVQAATWLLFFVLIIWLLQKTVVAPVKRLTDHTRAVRETGNLSLRLNLHRADEIGHLADSYDRLVERLEATVGELRTSEQLYRALTENSLACIALFQQGAIIFANRRTSQVTGYSLEELQQLGPQLLHPDDQETVMDRIALRPAQGLTRD
jgi:PAS domain-containing protein